MIREKRAVPQALTITIDDRARNVFFSHYVFGLSKTFDVLESLYGRSPRNKHLAASVDAVSLAFFSFQFHCSKASRIARVRYLYALPLLNEALEWPNTAKSNSMLLAVLLLDLFEKITNKNPLSAVSWMSHVNGALALVRLRENKPFHTHTDLRLSIRLSTNLLISCVAANARVPSALIKLRSDLEPFLDKNDPKWQVSGLVVKYAILNGAIQDGCLSGSEIITCTTELDHQFVLLAKNMPSTWLYSTTYAEETSERTYAQYFDRYPDHFTAQTWNVLRIMRILLNEMIRTSCVERALKSFKEASSSSYHLDIATHTIDMMAKEICASAPQYTSYRTAIRDSEGHSSLQILQCYTLIFPLYVAGSYASSTTRIKPWIIKQLRLMSDEAGVRNAGVVADFLETAAGVSPWSVYATLGSYAFAA